MSTFILTWNPAKWAWWEEEPPLDLQSCIDRTRAREKVPYQWSVGSRTSGIGDGDHAFLLRQGKGNRGIIAAGRLRGEVKQLPHWDNSGRLGNYADLDWELVMDPDHPLPLADLNRAMPEQNWTPQASGTVLRPEYEESLKSLWARHTAQLRS